MGDGADRDRASGGPALSAPLSKRSKALLDAIEAAPSASGWGAALVRYELLLLAELGFGLDLDRCAVTGAQRRSRRGQPEIGPGGQRRGGRTLCRQAAAAAAVRARGRHARHGAEIAQGPRPHRPFPDARPDDRPARGRSPKRARGSSNGCAAPVVSPRLVRRDHRRARHAVPQRRGDPRNRRARRGQLPCRAIRSVDRTAGSGPIMCGSRTAPSVAVQLLSRSWTIVDGRGTVHEVVGEGVVGEMPLIAPGRELRLCLRLPARHAERRR